MLEFAFGITAVYALLSYVMLGLGLTHLNNGTTVIAAVLLVSVAIIRIVYLAFRQRPLHTCYSYLLLGGLTFLAYSHAFLIPPFARDDMIYHLQIPKRMVMTGSLAFDPFNINSNFPLLFEMPFAVLNTLHLSVSPFIFNVFFAVLLVLVFHSALAHRTKLSAKQNFSASLVLATTPVIFDLLHTGYVEIYFTLLISLSALFYLRFMEEKSRSDWFRTCVCLGLSCAVKYPGVIFTGLFLAHEFFRSRDRKGFYTGAFLWAISACPWYMKNWMLTGNPVFPFANTFFDSHFISPARFQGFHHLLVDYNMGRTPLDYFLLPFRLALGVDEAKPGVYLGFDGSISLLFAVALTGLGWRYRAQRFITLLVGTYFIFWTIESQQARFLLAIVPIAAVFGLSRVAEFPNRALWIHLGVAVILAQNIWHISEKFQRENIISLLTGEMDRNAFLSAQMPFSYVLSGEINQRLDPQHDKLMTVGTFGRNYYFDIPTLSNTYYEQEPFRTAFESGKLQPDYLDGFLSANRVTYILFNWEYLRKMHSRDKGFDLVALQTWFTNSCKIVYTNQGTVLYKIIAKVSS